MDIKKNLKKLDKWKIGVVVILILVIVFLGHNYIQSKEIRQANINAYVFLEKVSKCDMVYSIDITSGKATTGFKKDCFENAASNLGDIKFLPGDKGDKFILESEEYLGCSYINNLKGSEAYRNCVREILPTIKDKYPEVVGS